MSASPLGPDWHPAGNADDFEDEDVEQVLVGEIAVAVYKAEGQFYATQDVCTHEHAYLSDGVVVDCIVECPFHQGRFDLRIHAYAGEQSGPPLMAALVLPEVEVREGRFEARFDEWHSYRDRDPGIVWVRERLQELAKALPALAA